MGLKLRTWLYGEKVAQDAQGNIYYRRKGYTGPWQKEPRWVIYAGIVNASKVPSLWHGWLHHTEQFPSHVKKTHHTEERPHLPNLTGTRHAFNPSACPSIRALDKPYTVWTPK